MINNNPQCRDELESIVAEADGHTPGAGATLQQVWDHDTENRQQFFHDQVHGNTGNKGNKWSLVTYRIGKLTYTCTVYVCVCVSMLYYVTSLYVCSLGNRPEKSSRF